jgi:transketolase
MTVSLAWLSPSEFRRVLGGITGRPERCRAFAAMTRINTLYMIARAGSGHLGSSFSAADLVSWLLLDEMKAPFTEDGDVYFSSKGHDAPSLYAALIGLGYLDDGLIHRLRRLDGLPGHPDVHTPHMPFNTGSLGMGISKAKGLVLADRIGGRPRRVYVMTGDGELQEGQNWEALAGAVHHRMGELTVIVDHNKIQSDTWVRDVSDLGDLPAKFASFGWGVLRCDGNDPAQLETVFRQRAGQYPDLPAVIIADTVKGAGTAVFAATSMREPEWRYRYHSGAPSTEDYRCAHKELLESANEILGAHGLAPLVPETVTRASPPPPSGPRFPELYGRALAERAAADKRIIVLDADLVLDTGLIPVSEAVPGRFIECGIAEQDMVSMASGLAAGGLLPFVHSFSCFLHARPNEHIYNNATEGRRIVYVGSLAGLLPAGPGHSHQAVRDVSALSAVPGLVILEPGTPSELTAAIDYCLTAPDSVYLRLVSVPCPAELAGLSGGELVAGRGWVVRQGGPVAAIGAGPVVLAQLLRAAELLQADGVDLTVVDLPWLNRVDRAWLQGLASGCSRLFVVENAFARGGQADMIARELLEYGHSPVPRFTGIGLTQIPRCGTEGEVLAAHGLGAEQLAATILAAPGSG